MVQWNYYSGVPSCRRRRCRRRSFKHIKKKLIKTYLYKYLINNNQYIDTNEQKKEKQTKHSAKVSDGMNEKY